MFDKREEFNEIEKEVREIVGKFYEQGDAIVLALGSVDIGEVWVVVKGGKQKCELALLSLVESVTEKLV